MEYKIWSLKYGVKNKQIFRVTLKMKINVNLLVFCAKKQVLARLIYSIRSR